MTDTLEKKLEQGFDALKVKYDEAIKRVEKGEEVNAELKNDIENAKGEIQRVVDQVRDLEEKGHGLIKQSEKKGLIHLIGDSPEYKARSGGKTMEIEIKGDDYASIMESKALVTVGTSGLIIPQYDPVIEPQPRGELLFTDLIPSIPVTSAEFTYFKQKVRANSAGMVAEGGAKPEGSAEFEAVTDRIKKIAEWIPITEEAADDLPQLMGFLQEMLDYDIRYRKEEQVLKGDGTGNNLNGIMTQALPYDPQLMKASDTDTKLDKLRRMIGQVRVLSKRSADFITMSEMDLIDIELMKSADNKYLFASIQGFTAPILWGRPVVVSDVMDDEVGETLVGYSRGAMIYDRQSMRVELGRINDDFIKNQFVLLLEMRLGLAVRNPSAFCKANLDPAGNGGNGGDGNGD